jgi:hypothetical protein
MTTTVPKTPAKHSRRDSRGMLYVDCSECTRGGNGTDPNKCSCGWQVKRGRKGGCFVGTLMPALYVKAVNP